MALGSLSLYALSLIILMSDAFTSGNISNLLSFLPYEVISKTQIWRLFPSFLFNTSIESFLLSFAFTQNLLAERERAQGTVLFWIELIIKTFIIDSTITLFYYIEINTYLFCYIHPSHGLWNMFFYMSTIKCFLQPLQETKLFFFDLKIINKFIPLIMNLIFILFIDPIGPIVSTSLGLLDACTVVYTYLVEISFVIIQSYFNTNLNGNRKLIIKYLIIKFNNIFFIILITSGSPCRLNFIKNFEEYLCCCFKNQLNFIRNCQAQYSQDTIEILMLNLNTISKNLFHYQQEGNMNKGVELPQTQSQISNVDKMLAYSQQQQQQQEEQ